MPISKIIALIAMAVAWVIQEVTKDTPKLQ